MEIVLHDTHHCESSRCHLLKVGDVRLIFTEEAWRQRCDLAHGNTTLDHYEQWKIVKVGKGFFVQERGDKRERVTWKKGHNVVTVLCEGPDLLYASTQELRDEAARRLGL